MRLARSAIMAAALLVSACSANQDSNRLMFGVAGAIVGGAAGGWAGSQLGGGTGETIFTVLGVAGGAMAGYDLGRQINIADRGDYSRAVASAASSSDGQATWSNRVTGNGGLVRTDTAFVSAGGEQCTTYRSTVTFDDEITSGQGAACRNPTTGEWVLVADAFH